MKYFVLLSLLFQVQVYSADSCNDLTGEKLLNLIKTNHPKLSEMKISQEASKREIEIAKIAPNPTVGFEGGVKNEEADLGFKIGAKYLHEFELGSKRKSRVNFYKSKNELLKTNYNITEVEVLATSIKNLFSLKQIYILMPIYEESVLTFKKILRKYPRYNSLTPELKVERETLALILGDYQLKLASLTAQEKYIKAHLEIYSGEGCIDFKKVIPSSLRLPSLSDFKVLNQKSLKVRLAQNKYDSVMAERSLRQAEVMGDLKVGPVLEYETIAGVDEVYLGVELELGIFGSRKNREISKKFDNNLAFSKQQLSNIKRESEVDLKLWESSYQSAKESLEKIVSIETVEKKHKRIERLFARGVVSTGLVIEAHEQLVEYYLSKFSFENQALDALLNLHIQYGSINSFRF